MTTQEFKPYKRKLGEAAFKELIQKNRNLDFQQFNGRLVQVEPIDVPAPVFLVIDGRRRYISWAIFQRLHVEAEVLGDPLYSLIPEGPHLATSTCLMEGLLDDNTPQGTVFLLDDGRLRYVSGRAAEQYQFRLGDNIVRVPMATLWLHPGGPHVPERP